MDVDHGNIIRDRWQALRLEWIGWQRATVSSYLVGRKQIAWMICLGQEAERRSYPATTIVDRRGITPIRGTT